MCRLLLLLLLFIAIVHFEQRWQPCGFSSVVGLADGVDGRDKSGERVQARRLMPCSVRLNGGTHGTRVHAAVKTR